MTECTYGIVRARLIGDKDVLEMVHVVLVEEANFTLWGGNTERESEWDL